MTGQQARARPQGTGHEPLQWAAHEVAMPAVVRVALPVPLARLFDYLPPAGGVAAGSRVLVPFGRKKMVGVVVASGVEAAVAGARLKSVLRVLDDGPLLDTELMQTLAWAADYWLAAPGEAYANALPLALREPRPLPETSEPCYALTVAGQSALDAGSRRGSSRALLNLLAGAPQDPAGLDAALPGWRPAARRLLEAGLVEQRAPVPLVASPTSAPPLSSEQQTAVDAVAGSFGRFQPFLLDGVTGSGK